MNHTGAGYSIRRGSNAINEGSRRIQDEATVFQAEIMAIKMAMEALGSNLQPQDRYIKIFSDSQAAIRALNSSTVTSQLVKDTVYELNKIGANVDRLEIAWIKAHVGHPGNERADELAREACELEKNTEGINIYHTATLKNSSQI